jgi:glycosyltransferase involved in cell wall biosynthesis
MHRVRMSASYFKDFGWVPTVVYVDEKHVDISKDSLLNFSLPIDLKKIAVGAFSKKWTNKIGLGSIALRSLYFYLKAVNQILKNEKFNLIYFTTTQFPVCVLGAYWKKRFKIPYVIDMQDPWHSDYYMNKPKNQRPPKYWFSYRLNKYLEPIAMNNVDGLISVSKDYIKTLTERYSRLKDIPNKVITFGAFEKDLEIATAHENTIPKTIPFNKEEFNVVYIGRGGYDMQKALNLLFKSFKKGLSNHSETFNKFHFYFIGTSYAAKGKGIPSVSPLAAQLEITNFVTEITDRIPFYQSLNLLAKADLLFITGSDSASYTASKIYPYLSLRKSLLAIFNPLSSAYQIIKECEQGLAISFNEDHIEDKIQSYLLKAFKHEAEIDSLNVVNFEKYSAKNRCKEQCDFFEEVLLNG